MTVEWPSWGVVATVKAPPADILNFTAYHLEETHDVCRAEEMQTDHVLRPMLSAIRDRCFTTPLTIRHCVCGSTGMSALRPARTTEIE